LGALAESAGASGQVETIYQIIRHLAANRRGVTLTGDPARPAGLEISAIS
jgi:glucose-6-phosphate isomerase